MTSHEFTAKTGYAPEQDDLERVNCEHAGEIGHQMYGWCVICDKPRFSCSHILPIHEKKGEVTA